MSTPTYLSVPAIDPDYCARCDRLIVGNPQWIDDESYDPICALDMAAEGHRVHGSRIQNRFWCAADQVRPGISADDWILEEWAVVIDGHNFRADFVIRPDWGVKIAIELDSFTHHSSAQALMRDRVRQRLWQKDGWLVVRFAGSEVWRNPDGCVAEVIEILIRELRDTPRLPAAA